MMNKSAWGENMPTSYKIFKEIGLVIVTCSGPANPEETIATVTRLQADPEFSLSYDVLWDARERTVPFTSDETMKIARYVDSYKGDKRSKRALLVSKDVNYGMARVYESLRYSKSHVEIEIFKDWEEALKWLGLYDHPLFHSNKS